MKKKILIIGADLSSNGGIASVIRSHYESNKKIASPVELYLLKTNHYKDKGFLFEIMILISSYIKFLGYMIFGKINLVHIHSSAERSFFRKSIFVISSKLFRKKLIIHLHSSKFYDFFLTKKKNLKKYISFVFGLSDVVVVLCKDWELKLNYAYPKINIRRIENPITFDSEIEYVEKIESAILELLFVGFFIETKGIKDVIAVAKELNNRKIFARITIAGKGDLEDYIVSEIKNNGLEDNIKLIGWISGDQKTKAFSVSDVFFLPSYNEGMPMSILEAMALGLPTISTTIAGIPDIIEEGENGFLLSPGDIEGYVDKIEILSKNRVLLKMMKNNSLKKADNYTGEVIYKKIYNLYKECIV